jgi:hypothetical protein
MSFILDALKKLERQKQKETTKVGDQPVMVGGRRWGENRSGTAFVWGSAIVAVAALVVAGLALYRSLTPSTPPSNDVSPVAATFSPPESLAPETSSPVEISSEDASESEEPSPVREASPFASSPRDAEEDEPVDLPDVEDVEEPTLDDIESVPPVRLTGKPKEEPTSEPAERLQDSPTSEIPAGLPELILQGTSVVDGKPIAVVNYQRLFEGDTIEGATVIRIADRSVELEYEGKRFTLTF